MFSRMFQAIRAWFAPKTTIERHGLSRRGFFAGTAAIIVSTLAKWTPQSVRQTIISDYLRSPEGRQRLAMSMIQPLRTTLDYTSLSRKIIQVEPMPPAARVFYGPLDEEEKS